MSKALQITCVRCPLGCLMNVEMSEETEQTVIQVVGNKCSRGKVYAHQEAVCPMRTITTLVRAENTSRPVSVKTTGMVPKARIAQVLTVISQMVVQPPVHVGDVLAENILDLGVNLVATSELKECEHQDKN